MILTEYITPGGETILYTGNPDLKQLDMLAEGAGDIWHSSFEQGYKNAFPELVYQTAIFFWYIKDFDNLDLTVSWRINPNHFAVRKNVWDFFGGFDKGYENVQTAALDFGYNALRLGGTVPLYVKGLFSGEKENVKISVRDRYVFFRKNFKSQHSVFMIYRKGIWRLSEWSGFFSARKNHKIRPQHAPLPARELRDISGNPTVSYIIPTMSRQDYTLQLLDDLSRQSYLPSQVVVVDATPEDQRDESRYDASKFPFELKILWQTTKGSCRARNEAIEVCTGEYIAFGDDDIRLPADFIENHIRFLQTNSADACNGLDIRASHHTDGLDTLGAKLSALGKFRWRAGAAQLMSNSNAFVKKIHVDSLGGNDINYDGGYGEDNDFGLSLTKRGVIFLQNPFSVNLHLKPPAGGYRVWGTQAKIMGKKRKTQPWELDTPVKSIRPVPSPTLMYYFHKQFGPDLVTEYRHKYFFLFLFKGPLWRLPLRLLRLPYRQLQFNKSIFYAKKLMSIGMRLK